MKMKFRIFFVVLYFLTCFIQPSLGGQNIAEKCITQLGEPGYECPNKVGQSILQLVLKILQYLCD